jgi:acetyltransferase
VQDTKKSRKRVFCMQRRNLDKFLRPSSVAVIGASDKANSVGRLVFQNLEKGGFAGKSFPINPKYTSVQGRNCFPSLADLRETVDLAIIATPASTVSQVVHDCGEHSVGAIIILSAGFREVGPSGQAIETELANVITSFSFMSVLGPNCLGILSPVHQLNASFAAAMPALGHIAFISQSGALCTSLLDWSLTEHVGFSHIISIGNALDVKVADWIDYLADDPNTDSIVLYIESLREARRFMSAARAFTRSKPIVVYKAGRFAESAQAAASHTGAMAGVDDVYEAAFRRAGIVRVFESADMFDCAQLLAHQRVPHGPRLAIISNAGGPAVMATDALLELRGKLSELTSHTRTTLSALLPPHWSHSNPVDILGDAGPERFSQALNAVLQDTNVDGVLVILSPQAMTDPTRTADEVARIAANSPKPVLAAWMGGRDVERGRQSLEQHGIATYDFPERAVRAFSYLVAYNRNRDLLYETPSYVPIGDSTDRTLAHQQLAQRLAEGHASLSEMESKALFAAYGVDTTIPQLATAAAQAVEIARGLNYPVVMKIASPQIHHKTEVQGVVLNVTGDDQVITEYKALIDRAHQVRPDAKIEGVTVQRMITSPQGVELIVGARKDPVFGAVMMIGAGGIFAELIEDRALELPPLNERLARRMLESLRIWPILQGYRGRRPVNLRKLIETLIRLSNLIADNPFVAELDVNPLLVTPDSVTALDGRVILHEDSVNRDLPSYSHLAIRPYPEEYVRREMLANGTKLLLRPIRPEDEPQWHQLLARCSKRSIWLRFRYLFKETTHEMATRFCFVDYDRTMAIVAEIGEGEARRLIGVSRLVADADHRRAEYAVLIDDAWQGHGLGKLLTDYCLEICRTWNVEQVVAETTVDNFRMRQILDKRGFTGVNTSGNELLFRKQISGPVAANS